MGQEASKPQAGTKLCVIGAGMSRTGTASFTAALETLLDGPVYDWGTQSTLGPKSEIRAWIECSRRIGGPDATIADAVKDTEKKNETGGDYWGTGTRYKPPRPDLARPHADGEYILRTLGAHLDGYAACCDFPFVMFVPELLRLYPNAKVVVTVRDVAAWERSMESVASVSLQCFLSFVLFPLPTLRHYPAYITALTRA